MSRDAMPSGERTDTVGDEPAQRDDSLSELAEDMLHVMQRLSAVERLLQEGNGGLERLARLVESSAAQQTRSLEQLRQELTGERRGLVVRALFHSVVHALDSLEILARAGAPGDQAAGIQAQAVSTTLRNLLQAIGFLRFDARPGDIFEPGRMQCLGYSEGPPGVVLEALQAGYAADDVMVRPAGVLIADPRAGSRASPGNDAAVAEGEEQ